MADFSSLKWFRAEERDSDGSISFPYPHKMSQALMNLLDQARGMAGVPFIITSSFRRGDPNSHGRGTGVDIRVSSSRDRFKIVTALLAVGFNRLGIYDIHIHADIEPELPEEVMWWGKSK